MPINSFMLVVVRFHLLSLELNSDVHVAVEFAAYTESTYVLRKRSGVKYS